MSLRSSSWISYILRISVRQVSASSLALQTVSFQNGRHGLSVKENVLANKQVAFKYYSQDRHLYHWKIVSKLEVAAVNEKFFVISLNHMVVAYQTLKRQQCASLMPVIPTTS